MRRSAARIPGIADKSQRVADLDAHA